VVSKIDYCNSVLAGGPGHRLDRLQSVLNAAARLIFSARKREQITPLLHELHWLRVPERIKFWLCVLAYRCLHGTAPSYLAESLHLSTDVTARWHLWSAAHTLGAVKLSLNSGRPCVSGCSITCMEQSASCCQRHAVAAVFLSTFEDITVPVIIPLLTVSPVALYSYSISATSCKVPLQ